jgi:hypothetical protein
MAGCIKLDVTSCPLDISAFDSQAVMFLADTAAQSIKQFRRMVGNGLQRALFHGKLLLHKETI